MVPVPTRRLPGATTTRLEAFSVLEWTHSSGTRHVLDSRNPHSIPFFCSGWYPAEIGNTHRWMMNEAKIALPLIFPQSAFMQIEMHAFTDSSIEHRTLTLMLNDEVIGECGCYPGWKTYISRCCRKPGFRGVNILKFSVPRCREPAGYRHELRQPDFIDCGSSH